MLARYDARMCCFSAAHPASWIDRIFRGAPAPLHVSNTSIFARFAGPETQLLVYSMKLAVGAEVAMILPLPTLPTAGEDALSFVDLQKHPKFFDDLAFLFAPPMAQAPARGGMLAFGAPQTLKVHKVGSFVASFVPQRRDFSRLDPRFRLPDAALDALPDARDFGFAVFQLEKGEHTIHPMAMRFRTRDPQRLFFPTVHVHDGTVHATADFDHALYFQHPRVTELASEVPPSLGGVAKAFFSLRSDYEGVANLSQPVLRKTMRGRFPNRDTYVEL
jgi:hypothetical protein